MGALLSLAMIISCAAWSPASYAEKKTFDIGHNLTPTTNTLKPGGWMIGNYAVAYGLSESIFLATSPWVWVNYNTINFHLKWAPPARGSSRVGVFASYFESLRRAFLGDAPYYWQSASLHLLYSYEWNREIKTHFSVRTSYYWNDDKPYSIRMDSGDNALRGQIDLTSLTRFKVSNSSYDLGFEFGTVGANYVYPYMHLGASALYTTESWLLQFGFSYTVQWNEFRDSKGLRPGRIGTRSRQSPSDGNLYLYPYETALHPEIQVQYYF